VILITLLSYNETPLLLRHM